MSWMFFNISAWWQLTTSIFLSHSSNDRNVVSFFQNAFSGTNVNPFLMEYENYRNPPWSVIRKGILESSTLFLLLGPNLNSSPYTQNWVSYEVGVADASDKQVWVLEDIQSSVPFPIPNAHHYLLYNSTDSNSLQYLQTVIRSYSKNLGGALLGGLAGLALSTNPLVALAGLIVGSQLNVPPRPEISFGALTRTVELSLNFTILWSNFTVQHVGEAFKQTRPILQGPHLKFFPLKYRSKSWSCTYPPITLTGIWI